MDHEYALLSQWIAYILKPVWSLFLFYDMNTSYLFIYLSKVNISTITVWKFSSTWYLFLDQ